MDNRNTTKYSKELRKLLDKKIEHGEYVEVVYSSSGNMLANTDDWTLFIKDKVLEVRYSESHNIPVHVTKYKVSDKDIKEIITIIDNYNLVAFSTLKEQDIVVLDGPNTYFEIGCAKDNGRVERFTIGYLTDYPAGGREMVGEAEKKLFSFKKEENIIEEYDEEKK